MALVTPWSTRGHGGRSTKILEYNRREQLRRDMVQCAKLPPTFPRKFPLVETSPETPDFPSNETLYLHLPNQEEALADGRGSCLKRKKHAPAQEESRNTNRMPPGTPEKSARQLPEHPTPSKVAKTPKPTKNNQSPSPPPQQKSPRIPTYFQWSNQTTEPPMLTGVQGAGASQNLRNREALFTTAKKTKVPPNACDTYESNYIFTRKQAQQ